VNETAYSGWPATTVGGIANRAIRSRIAANKFRVTATSASWNITYLECRALLLSVGLADGAVQVEDQLLGRLPPMDLVDPLAGKIRQRREIALVANRVPKRNDSNGKCGTNEGLTWW